MIRDWEILAGWLWVVVTTWLAARNYYRSLVMEAQRDKANAESLLQRVMVMRGTFSRKDNVIDIVEDQDEQY